MEKNGSFYPTGEHQKVREKKRHLIWQLDALGEAAMRGMEPKLYRKFIFGYIDRGGSRIDSIYWDFMLSGDFYAMYESAILPRRKGPPFDRWIEAGFDMMGELTAGAKKRGLESVLVHRIAEVDIADGGADYREKAGHPEWTVKGSWYDDWLRENGRPAVGLLNIASPEVQRRKLAVLEELLRKYPFDGLEIDLCRHTPFLPRGKEWENRAALTEFMASLRRMLDGLETEIGHPFLLSIRTGESPDGIKRDGVDAEEMLSRNIIDSITAGGRSFSPDLEGYRALIDRYGGNQQLYPTIDYHHATDGYACPPIEVWRGMCADCYARGADAIKLFNWWTCSEEQRRTVAEEGNMPELLDFAPNAQDQAVCELGDREFLKTADKTHVAERRGGYPWSNGYSNTNCDAPLPMNILEEGDIRIFVSEETVNCQTAEFSVLTSRSEGADLQVYLNGRRLKLLTVEDGYRDGTIPPEGEDWASGYRPDRRPATVRLRRFLFSADGAMLNGVNRIRFETDRPLRVEKCELAVRYAETGGRI